MTCTKCQAQTADSIYLCHACSTRLEDVLERIPDALATIQDTVARMDRTGTDDGGSSGDHAEAVNADALDAKIELEELVHSWARMVLEHEGRDDLRSVEPLPYLRVSVHIIRGQDFAGDLLDELDRALASVERAADTPVRTTQLGPCYVEHEDGTQCQGGIRVRAGDGSARCSECGATYDAKEVRLHRISESWHIQAPLSLVVKALRLGEVPVTIHAARQWVKRGHLKPAGYDTDGVALYTPKQVDDVRRGKRSKRQVA